MCCFEIPFVCVCVCVCTHMRAYQSNQAAITEYRRLNGINNRNLFLKFWRVESPRTRCWLIQFLCKGPLPGLQMTAFLLYAHMVESEREREIENERERKSKLWLILLRGLHLHLNLIISRPPSPNWVSGLQHINWRRYIQFLTVCACVLALSFWRYTCCKLIVFISCTVWKQPFLQGALVHFIGERY